MSKTLLRHTLISWNLIFIWETGYWTRAIQRFALFDLLKSLSFLVVCVQSLWIVYPMSFLFTIMLALSIDLRLLITFLVPSAYLYVTSQAYFNGVSISTTLDVLSIYRLLCLVIKYRALCIKAISPCLANWFSFSKRMAFNITLSTYVRKKIKEDTTPIIFQWSKHIHNAWCFIHI
jgi:hypothetical protein